MVWSLTIEHFGLLSKGDCTIVTATFTSTNGAAQSRTMVIDGGLLNEGNDVTTYLGARNVDVAVATHFDGDHYMGLRPILAARALHAPVPVYDQVFAANGGTFTYHNSCLSSAPRYVANTGTLDYANAGLCVTGAGVTTLRNAAIRITDTTPMPANVHGQGAALPPFWTPAASWVGQELLWHGLQSVNGVAYNPAPQGVNVAQRRRPNPVTGSHVARTPVGLPGAPTPGTDPLAPKAYLVSMNREWASMQQYLTPPLPAVLTRGVVANAGGAGGAANAAAANSEKNIRSLGVLVVFNNFRYYVAGDLESGVEDDLVNNNQDLLTGRIQVIKASHHGSEGASSTTFLNRTNPSVVIASCGYANSYGLPHIDFLTRVGTLQATHNPQPGQPRVPALYLTGQPMHSDDGITPYTPPPAVTGGGNTNIARAAQLAMVQAIYAGQPQAMNAAPRGNIVIDVDQIGSLGPAARAPGKNPANPMFRVSCVAWPDNTAGAAGVPSGSDTFE